MNCYKCTSKNVKYDHKDQEYICQDCGALQ